MEPGGGEVGRNPLTALSVKATQPNDPSCTTSPTHYRAQILEHERAIARFRPTISRHRGDMKQRALETLAGMEEKLASLVDKKAKCVPGLHGETT